MKAVGVILQVFFFVLLLVGAGCESVTSESLSKTAQLSVYTRYTPVKIDIMPLTEFIWVGDDEEPSKIRVYVSLLDAFDCQMKTPAVFRFELYEYIQRSAEPKGRRIIIRPDIDLIDTVENNEHWRDFLRAYEFNLDFEPESSQSYILQATCLCADGKRLSAEFGLKHTR
jgi:hypothetical protein